MKNLILGFALVACVAACKSSSSAEVTDPKNPNMPKAECEGMKECSGEAKAECSAEKKACCPSQKPQG